MFYHFMQQQRVQEAKFLNNKVANILDEITIIVNIYNGLRKVEALNNFIP